MAGITQAALIEDLKRREAAEARGFGANALFDVGANRGQSYKAFRKGFPEAEIHCFEPAPETFARLEKAVAGDVAVQANRMGLGATPGRAAFTTGQGTNNQRLQDGAGGPGDHVEVEILTGDGYCRDRGIGAIDFLKIDAEGYDLDVLVGFGDMLRAGRIRYLQVECTTSLDNRFHVHLERFIHFLHPFNYRLSDLIEPVRRVNRTKQRLRGIWFCNAVFAREVDDPKLRRDGIN